MDAEQVTSDISNVKEQIDKGIQDINPPQLKKYIETSLDQEIHTPGLLYIYSRRRIGEEPDYRKAAGLQFLFTGLNLTRNVITDPDAWEEFSLEPEEKDLELLAAQMLVTRAFDCLIDNFKRATTALNQFGRAMYRANQSRRSEEKLRHETSAITAIHNAAIDIASSDNDEELHAVIEASSVIALMDNPDRYRETTDPRRHLEESIGNAEQEITNPYLYELLRDSLRKREIGFIGLETESN